VHESYPNLRQSVILRHAQFKTITINRNVEVNLKSVNYLKEYK